MNYKKKLALAKEALDSGSYDKETIEYIFPELAESKDEKIRKALIRYHQSTLNIDGVKGEEILAWLEKQGEPFDDNIITRDDEMLQAISIGLTDVEEDLGWSDFGGLPIEEILAWLEKQENSPILSNSAKTGKNWTEEDEIGSDATIELLEYFNNYAPEFRRPAIRRSIDWLKSLKQRMEG